MLAAHLAAEPDRSPLRQISDGAHGDTMKATLQSLGIELRNRMGQPFTQRVINGHVQQGSAVATLFMCSSHDGHRRETMTDDARFNSL